MKSGKGSYDAVMKGLDAIKEAFGDLNEVNVRGTFTEESVADVYLNLISMSELGFSKIAYFPEDIRDGWSEPGYSRLREIGAQVFRERRTTFRSLAQLTPFDRFTRRYPERQKSTKHHCGAGRSIFGVSVRGEVVPCHRFTSKPAQELILGEGGWQKPARILEESISAECSSCPLFQRACHGGCWAVSYYDHGNLAVNSPHSCRWHRALWAEGATYRSSGDATCATQLGEACRVCVSCESCHSNCDACDACNACDGCHSCQKCDSCEVCVSCESTCQTCENCHSSCDGCESCHSGCESCNRYDSEGEAERCTRCHGYSD
jgi:radical SAM protein with 4Fe4S-binding SPASM domain